MPSFITRITPNRIVFFGSYHERWKVINCCDNFNLTSSLLNSSYVFFIAIINNRNVHWDIPVAPCDWNNFPLQNSTFSNFHCLFAFSIHKWMFLPSTLRKTILCFPHIKSLFGSQFLHKEKFSCTQLFLTSKNFLSYTAYSHRVNDSNK